MYKITERVEAEYGPNDYDKITSNLEPFGILSLVAMIFLIIYAALFC